MARGECDPTSTHLIAFFKSPFSPERRHPETWELSFQILDFLELKISIKYFFRFKTIFQYKDRPFLV